MKKHLLMIMVFVLGLAIVVYAAWDGATNYPGALDTSTELYDVEDDSIVQPEHHDALAQAVIAIETKLGTGADTPTATDILTGTGVGTSGWVTCREFSTLDIVATDETNTNITESQIIANKFITIQGSSSNADLVLPDLEYYVTVVFIVNEAFIIEINPPNADAHEALDLDGTVLDASDCVRSTATVGAKLAATRMQIADGTWKWSLDTIRGAWTDGGASD